MSRTTIYTLATCPACVKLREDWTSQGIDFEEKQVDESQENLDEALNFGDEVPIIVYGDGRVEVGYANMIG